MSGQISRGDRVSRVVHTARDDARALGWYAPMRAALEVSKRTGAHAAIFGRLARRAATESAGTGSSSSSSPSGLFVLPFSPPGVDVIGPQALARAVDEAERIAAGSIEIFGRSLELGVRPDWHAALDGPGRWPEQPWWKIDIRSTERLGDVKWVWELGRHRHLVVLARAAYLSGDDASTPFAAILEDQLVSWMDDNPAEIGIHWYSNLEVALRAVAWVQILGLAGDQLSEATTRRMHTVLHHSGRHLLADVPYTVSTMRNNHLVGDALGLSLLGRCFPDDAVARRWHRIGDWLFDRQLRTQMHDDGSMIEDSVSYHRFVVEMFMVGMLMGGDAVRPSLDASARFLARLGALDGPVPFYGDADDGRVLVASAGVDGGGTAPVGDPAASFEPVRSELAGTTLAALALAAAPGDPRRSQIEADRDAADEIAWYVPTSLTPAHVTARTDPPASETRDAITIALVGHAETDGQPIGGGISRGRRGSFDVWLKGGGSTSHGHADLCSVYVRHDDNWLIADPGTGTYNGPVAQRDYFRTSGAHAVLRIDDVDQLEPHRAFRWRHEPVGGVGQPVATADALVLWSWHGMNRRLDPSRRLARTVVLTEAGVTVTDWVEGPAVAGRLALPLPAGASFDGSSITVADAVAAMPFSCTPTPSAITAHLGELDPFDGWTSLHYGALDAAPRVELDVRLAAAPTGDVNWFTWRLGADGTPIHDGDGSLSIPGADVHLTVTFAATEIVLRVAVGDAAPVTRSLPTT